MKNLICAFLGHRDTPYDVKPLLRKVIVELIEKGVKQFYVGNQGNFDIMAHELLSELKASYRISFDIVLAYMPKNGFIPYDMIHTIFPEGMETVPPRFAIEYRNKWMIAHSDIVVTYVTHSFGGAAKFKEFASKKGKIIIELGSRAYASKQ